MILGLDAAWGGLGWCLACSTGPLEVGYVALASRTWRMQALREWLDGTLAPVLVDASLRLGPADPLPRVVIEEAPQVYSGRGARGEGPPGNQAATCYGLGRLAGAVELWAYQPGALGYPWLVTPSDWRGWWKLTGKGRLDRKRAAVAMVTQGGWGSLLASHPWKGDDGGPRADVAEAILIAVGAARNVAKAPVGPRNGLPLARPPVRR